MLKQVHLTPQKENGGLFSENGPNAAIRAVLSMVEAAWMAGCQSSRDCFHFLDKVHGTNEKGRAQDGGKLTEMAHMNF
ncbi:hypothetical protein PsAD46_04465 [Pseudovibrio sp. Ad46]|nr:hypothetical protein PsAD46_04465 [Pseudovibrio sp. Ad46]